MGWEDILETSCKLVFVFEGDFGTHVIFREKVIREVSILGFFGTPLATIQTNTSFFDVDADMLAVFNIRNPSYPHRLSVGNTFIKADGSYWTSTLNYEHYATTDWSYSDPGTSYGGFYTPEGARFLERLVTYRKQGTLDGFLGVIYGEDDFQQEIEIDGRMYGYSQAKSSYSLNLWRSFLYSDTRWTWICSETAIPFHCFVDPPQEPVFEHLLPVPGSMGSLRRDETFSGEVDPIPYTGNNPPSHPLYGAWISTSNGFQGGTSWYRISCNIPGIGWEDEGGGGIVRVLRRIDIDFPISLPTSTVIPLINLITPFASWLRLGNNKEDL